MRPKARRAIPAVAAAKADELLELALPSGTRLRFPVGTDPHYLRSLAAALQPVLSIPRSVRIYIASAPTDMRRSIDGLMALVTDELKEDAYSGHLFVFLSRRADRVKILTWDNGGFVLYYKRLEQGRFRPLQVDANATAVEIGATQLLMLLDGIDRIRPVNRVPDSVPARWYSLRHGTRGTRGLGEANRAVA